MFSWLVSAHHGRQALRMHVGERLKFRQKCCEFPAIALFALQLILRREPLLPARSDAKKPVNGARMAIWQCGGRASMMSWRTSL